MVILLSRLHSRGLCEYKADGEYGEAGDYHGGGDVDESDAGDNDQEADGLQD